MIDCGLYIHIPFCEKKCNYCSFFSCIKNSEIIKQYVDELCCEIKNFSKKHTDLIINTIYFGGGTPSILDIKCIDNILQSVVSSFDIKSDAEITLEINPVSSENIRKYRELGINRISVGVQTCDDDLLNKIGRLHDSKRAVKALSDSAEYFENVSADIILGIDSQQNPIKEFAFVSPFVKHISSYMLSLEPSTKLFNDVKLKNVAIATENEVINQYNDFLSLAKQHGFLRYETSNLAISGFESKHNSSYWDLTPYIGFGAGAHSYFKGRRYYNKPDINRYLNGFHSGNGLEMTEREADFNEDKTEYVMLSLRTVKGIDLLKYEKKFNSSFVNDFSEGIKKAGEYLDIDSNFVSILPDYFLLQNSIIGLILD